MYPLLPTLLQDIPAGIDTIVSSLALDTADRSLLVAGCADGTVRMYDKREPPTSRYVCVCVYSTCTIVHSCLLYVVLVSTSCELLASPVSVLQNDTVVLPSTSTNTYVAVCIRCIL